MMRVLVLGATGFVGKRVVAALAASDWAIPIASGRRPAHGRPAPGRPAPGRPAPGRLVLDATDAAAVAGAASQVDAVVNCIAGDAATIVANARALAGTTGRIVHLSSMAVYGSVEGVVDETAPLLGDNGAYAAAKAEAERILAPAPGLVILRPGCIYGPGSPQWTGRIARLLAARRIGDLGAAGDGCSNIVHVDDVVAAILSALRSPDAPGQAFNLSMPGAPDWNAYFLALARATGAVPIRRVPAWRITVEKKLLAIPLTLAGRVMRGAPPVIPPSLARLWAQDIRLDSTRAGAMLGIDWTPLDQGIARSADWLAGDPSSSPRT